MSANQQAKIKVKLALIARYENLYRISGSATKKRFCQYHIRKFRRQVAELSR